MILRISAQLFEATSRAEDRLLRRLFDTIDELDQDRNLHAIRLHPEDAETNPAGPLQRWLGASGVERPLVEELIHYGPIIEAQQPFPGEPDAYHQPNSWRRSGPLVVHVERRSQSDWAPPPHQGRIEPRLTLDDAVALIREPVWLHMENRRHDLAFLRGLAVLARQRELDQLQNAPGRVFVVGGGTGELHAWLRDLAEQPALAPEQLRRLWRSWVMFDRDADHHDVLQPSPAIRELIRLCEQVSARHGIPLTWVCLQRREIESYVPDEGLRRVARQKRELGRRLCEWRSRPDRQEWAWAYDMKRGLFGDLLPGLPEERRHQLRAPDAVPQPDDIKAPYSALGGPERRLLARGLGEGLLNRALQNPAAYPWLVWLGDEYDRGPAHQISREALIQSLFDRC